MTLSMLRSSAPLGRWDPFREIQELQTRMNQLMASAFGPGIGGTATESTSLFAPLADVTETDDAYLVEIEVPGVRQEDLDIEVNGSELAVTGEFKEQEREGLLRQRTRRVGRFEYRTTLPADVNTENIQANLDEGVLTVRVPKTEAARPRRIAIGGGTGRK